jgi:hypothetical protein
MPIWLLTLGSMLKKIPWQIWVCAGLVVLIAGWGELRHYQGKQEIKEEWKASIQRGKVIVEGLVANQGKITEKIVVKYQTKYKVIYEKGDTIEKLIPQYIPTGTCMLPGGFRLLHDASATNTLPEPASGTTAQPVPVEDVARIINFNYTLCHAERTKLDALWEWAQAQRKAYLELCKQRGVVCNKGS